MLGVAEETIRIYLKVEDEDSILAKVRVQLSQSNSVIRSNAADRMALTYSERSVDSSRSSVCSLGTDNDQPKSTSILVDELDDELDELD